MAEITDSLVCGECGIEFLPGQGMCSRCGRLQAFLPKHRVPSLRACKESSIKAGGARGNGGPPPSRMQSYHCLWVNDHVIGPFVSESFSEARLTITFPLCSQ